MKRIIRSSMMLLTLTLMLSSCFTYKYNVGDGAQLGIEITEKNHYFISGLAPGGQSNIEEMAGGASDYSVKIEHSFIDGLINAITFGIYTPTTTTVIK